MRTPTMLRPTAAGEPVRDPARAAALHRLAGATSGAPVALEPAAAAPVAAAAAEPAPPRATVPWAEPDPDGLRPEREVPEGTDPSAWADPPWWRRVRWAPDRLAGIALVVVVVALGVFSVHRLLATVPEAAPVPDLPLSAPGEPVPGEGAPGTTAGSAPGAGPGEGAGAGTAAAPGAATEELVVSVVGLVHRSGLVVLEPGARVADALDAAGGVLEGGDRDGLNLARRVADGEQILVGVAPGPEGPRGPRSGVVGPEPTQGDAGPGASPGGGSAPGAAPGGGAGGLVNLNTADEAALDALPGVGPVTAASILGWRSANGPFSSVDQLAEVDGIGPATLSRLRPLVTV